MTWTKVNWSQTCANLESSQITKDCIGQGQSHRLIRNTQTFLSLLFTRSICWCEICVSREISQKTYAQELLICIKLERARELISKSPTNSIWIIEKSVVALCGHPAIRWLQWQNAEWPVREKWRPEEQRKLKRTHWSWMSLPYTNEWYKVLWWHYGGNYFSPNKKKKEAALRNYLR